MLEADGSLPFVYGVRDQWFDVVEKIFGRKTHAVLKSGTDNIVQRLAWATRCQRGSRQLPCFADLGSQAQKARVMHW